MNAARLRLILAAVLFAGWIGWLAHLAFSVTNSIILSRAQLLVSDLEVVALVDADPADDRYPNPIIKVEKVLWPKSRRTESLGTIEVGTLGDISNKLGWRGPGRYIIPLQDSKGKGYRLAPIPPSPGFSHHGSTGFIYLATPEVLNQYEEIRSGNWQ